MTDPDATDPEAPVADPVGAVEVISGEAVPPDEHTARVAALRKKHGQTALKIHDPPSPPSAETSAGAGPEKSSSQMAQQSKRVRRRARDARAEKIAQTVTLSIFLGLGGALLLLFNSGLLDGDPADLDHARQASESSPPASSAHSGSPSKGPNKPLTSARLDETPNLPALRFLASEGMTIAAEGLPEVAASGVVEAPASVAALETCRFAFAVWEFSPNKRFRFLTTCPALKGQIMVGAYEISGSTIRMSALVDPPVQILSVFEVEKPSRLVSSLRVDHPGTPPITLVVNQRVTTIRAGIEGEAFRDTYAPRNTMQVQIPLPEGRSPDQ